MNLLFNNSFVVKMQHSVNNIKKETRIAKQLAHLV